MIHIQDFVAEYVFTFSEYTFHKYFFFISIASEILQRRCYNKSFSTVTPIRELQTTDFSCTRQDDEDMFTL